MFGNGATSVPIEVAHLFQRERIAVGGAHHVTGPPIAMNDAGCRAKDYTGPARHDPGMNDVTSSNDAGTTAECTITWMLR
jgi:hypothetical protein